MHLSVANLYEHFMDGCKWSIDWLILRACVCAAAHLHAEGAPVSIPMAFSLCIYLSVIVSVHAVNLSYTNLTCFSAAANTQTHTQAPYLHTPPPLSLTRAHWLAPLEQGIRCSLATERWLTNRGPSVRMGLVCQSAVTKVQRGLLGFCVSLSVCVSMCLRLCVCM